MCWKRTTTGDPAWHGVPRYLCRVSSSTVKVIEMAIRKELFVNPLHLWMSNPEPMLHRSWPTVTGRPSSATLVYVLRCPEMSVPFWASWYSSGWRFRRLPAGPCRVSLVLTASRWQVSPRQPVSGLYAPSPPSHERVSCSPIVRDVRGDVHRRRLMASRPGQALKTDFRLSIDGLLPK